MRKHEEQLALLPDAEIPEKAEANQDIEKQGSPGRPRSPEQKPRGLQAGPPQKMAGSPGRPLRAINPADEPPPDAELTIKDIKRPCYGVYDDFHRIADNTSLFPNKPGLYWHDEDKQGEPVDTWVCEPLHVEAMSHDEAGQNFGRMLRFRDTTGRWREWLLPMSMLSGSGETLFAELLGRGHTFDIKQKSRLLGYLMQSRPDARLVAATRTGWHGDNDAFVLPSTTLGDQGYRFQADRLQADNFKTKGSSKAWRESIGRYCVGNTIMLLAVSTALAGPLLLKAKQQTKGGGGIHFRGQSSKGKSTAMQAANSVWGSPDLMGSWKATGNGLEALAASMNDTLLTLDELSESSPFEAGNMVYLLMNGHGKQRAARTGGVRQAACWRLMVLSNGERSLAAHMAEGGKKPKAGQEARLLDIPATNRKHGAFDDLHGLADGRAFADEIKQATSQNYGHVGPAFIKGLMSYSGDLPKLYSETLSLPELEASDGVEARAAGTFALLATAGELATDMGLTGWPEDEALNAAIEGFNLWRSERGQGNTESRHILEGIVEFIEVHGDGRFSDINANPEQATPIRNRAGYWENRAEGRIWYFNSNALKEAGSGYDIKEISRTLADAGWLAETDGSKNSVRKRIGGQRPYLYAVRPQGGEA